MSKLTTSIRYDINYKIGEEEFIFKAIPFKYFPKAFSILSKFSTLEENSTGQELMELLDEDTLTKLTEIQKIMVSNSYPDLPEDEVERFVTSNLFQLIEPLTKLCVDTSKHELPAKNR